MKDFAGSEVYVGHGVIPSISTAVDGSCALEVRQRQRESSPPNQPVSRAKIECPILTKFSVVPLQLSGDTNSDPLPPVLIPTPIMPSCYRLSTPLSGSFLVFTSVSRWVCSGSTFVNLDRINPLLRFSRSR